jgi:hypothetical protein
LAGLRLPSWRSTERHPTTRLNKGYCMSLLNERPPPVRSRCSDQPLPGTQELRMLVRQICEQVLHPFISWKLIASGSNSSSKGNFSISFLVSLSSPDPTPPPSLSPSPTPIADICGRQIDLAPCSDCIDEELIFTFQDNSRPEAEMIRMKVINLELLVLQQIASWNFPSRTQITHISKSQ